LSLLARVSALLERRGTQHALIGAAALAAHGVPRATADVDLLVVETACLDDSTWAELGGSGVRVEIRRGDAADPLAGVVRVTAEGDSSVDIIVGRYGWQRDIAAQVEARLPELPPECGALWARIRAQRSGH
jgi:hypothetical protein